MDNWENVLGTLTDGKDYVINYVTDGKNNVTKYFTNDIATTRKKLITTCALCTLIGIIIGFVFSPIKKGVYFNISNNGNLAPTDEKEEKGCKKDCKKKFKK